MDNLAIWQYSLITIIFVWSGFVRSGLGFGGALFALPLLLLVHNDPLVFLPIIGTHLLLFSMLTSVRKLNEVDWRYLLNAFRWMIVPKLVAVWGLLTLPDWLLSNIVFAIVTFYGLHYVLNLKVANQKPWLDKVGLMLGGYVSGTSLIAAPILVAVFKQYVKREQLRSTLFALWFILVTIKMIAFILADVDLQLIHHTWLLPAATIGHFLGLMLHKNINKLDELSFNKFLGVVFLIVSAMGLWQNLSWLLIQ